MSTARIGKNVEAYDPETDPAKLDFESLRLRGWPTSVVDCVQELQQPRSPDLLGSYATKSEAP
jgi:hypothetical protein